MKVRLYFPAWIDLDLPPVQSELVAAVLQRTLEEVDDEHDAYPTPDDEANWEQVAQMLCAHLEMTDSGDLSSGGLTEWSAVCRGCGCTDAEGCFEGCTWVEPDLCSMCVPGHMGIREDVY